MDPFQLFIIKVCYIYSHILAKTLNILFSNYCSFMIISFLVYMQDYKFRLLLVGILKVVCPLFISHGSKSAKKYDYFSKYFLFNCIESNRVGHELSRIFFNYFDINSDHGRHSAYRNIDHHLFFRMVCCNNSPISLCILRKFNPFSVVLYL